jgi:tyrosyl-tRNA synthetase
MGKTAAGAVWLNPSRLSPYDYWQYWRNTEDADVGRFLKLFTDVPMDEIARLEQLQGSEINDAKIVLANEATTLCHGAAAARNAAETARRTFVEGGLGQDLPVLEIDRGELEAGIAAYDLLRRSGLVASNGEGRRLIKGGGARLNDAVLVDENRKIVMADLDSNGVVKLSFGKKKHAVVRVR